MVLDEFARELFGFLCHQDPGRTWDPGGVGLAMCARCVGFYAGLALALPMLLVVRRAGGKVWWWVHGFLIMQAAVFGFNLVPHGATVRTLSGQLFAVGVLYFLSRAVWRIGPRLGETKGRWLFGYVSGMAVGVGGLGLLVRLDWAGATTVVNVLALVGLGVFVGLAGVLSAGLIRRRVCLEVLQACVIFPVLALSWFAL